MNECGKPLNESMERIIYEVKLVNGSNHIVTFTEIFDLVGDEKSTMRSIPRIKLSREEKMKTPS